MTELGERIVNAVREAGRCLTAAEIIALGIGENTPQIYSTIHALQKPGGGGLIRHGVRGTFCYGTPGMKPPDGAEQPPAPIARRVRNLADDPKPTAPPQDIPSFTRPAASGPRLGPHLVKETAAATATSATRQEPAPDKPKTTAPEPATWAADDYNPRRPVGYVPAAAPKPKSSDADALVDEVLECARQALIDHVDEAAPEGTLMRRLVDQVRRVERLQKQLSGGDA